MSGESRLNKYGWGSEVTWDMEGCESLRSCRELKAALLEGMRLEAKEREAGKLERMEVAEEVGKEERKLGSGGLVNWCEVGSRCIGTCIRWTSQLEH